MVRPCVARVFVDLAGAVLHQCIRPLIGARCAPGHHKGAPSSIPVRDSLGSILLILCPPGSGQRRRFFWQIAWFMHHRKVRAPPRPRIRHHLFFRCTPGPESPRGHWCATASLKRRDLVEELLEQLSQPKRWSGASVGQNRRRFIGVAIELPFDIDRRSTQRGARILVRTPCIPCRWSWSTPRFACRWERENPLRNQCSRWISVARGAPRYLAKVRRFASRKAIQNQLLTSSVLNPRSRELWRKTVRETEFRVTAGAARCGGLRANVRVYWVFLRRRKWAENVARG
jgi:hypothetical protein